MNADFDLVILGSGFGGSLLSMVARRIGLRVLLIERGTHPRFAIGESTSPLTNLLLEELAQRYDLPRLLPLASYGAWKRAYPELTVGLKRGFTFYHHRAGEPFSPDPERQNELLVAASPEDEVADTHWFRADFDHFLVREAVALGVEYLDRTEVQSLTRGPAGWELALRQDGEERQLRGRFVVDATGPRGALARLLGLPEEEFPEYPRTEALFTHFAGVRRFSDVASTGDRPPYPPDDAALHHVFDGGWIWVLRFENGITSVGIAAEERLARELRLEEGESAWRRVLDRYPSVGWHFQDAEPVRPFIHQPRLSYRCGATAGGNWALLPSAAAFVDPLFSTGFPLTLLGIHRLASVLERLDDPAGLEQHLAAYASASRREAGTTARLISACYRSFRDFPRFAALSMLYFAAASYSEMARRLERRHLAPEFLLGGRNAFRSSFDRCCGAAIRGEPWSAGALFAGLEPFNVAGLCDPEKRNWYGVDLQDVLRGAGKLEATPREVETYFRSMGWLR